ncbi:MAG: amidohydrolase family protein [Clostridiales bacterium]|nr:amidohydrolase family protein [Clostridiales bacterium]
MFYIKNGTIVTENDVFRGFIGIEDGLIALVGVGDLPKKSVTDIDAGGRLVTPGFIDIHCHGGGGALFADDPKTALRAHLKNGTTGVLPTIGYNMPAIKFIESVKLIAGIDEPEILGINCEGPFINPGYGADTRLVSNFDASIMEEIYNAGNGKIKIWMFSPEIEGAEEMKKFLLKKAEIILCAGHTECSKEQLKDIELICHLYDAMGPKERKISAIHENGTAEVVLASDDLYAELIVDSEGMHVPPELLKIAHRCLGDRCILISDAVSTSKDGFEVNYNVLGEISGSLLSVSKAVCNMKKHIDISWPEAVRLGSLNPATLLNIEKTTGSIKPGKKANIVIMDENANIHSVYSEGRRI